MRSSAVNIGDNAAAAQYNDLRKDAFAAAHLLPHEQATPDLTLKVESGISFIGITKVVFAGGNSPSFTAPTTNPRIDLLVIDSAGTLSRVVGTEAASPSVPTYPTDKVVLCEVFNRVGQTTIRDTDVAGQGYIQRDARPFLGGTFISDNSQVAAGASISPSKLNAGNVDADWLPDADNTRKLGSAARRWLELRATNLYGDGANITGIAVTKLEENYTAGEAINASTTPQAVFLKASDGKVWLADADFDENTYKFVGFVGGGQNVSANATVKVTLTGLMSGFSSLTVGAKYYVSSTAGAINTAPAGNFYGVGMAITASVILILPTDMKSASGSSSRGSGTTSGTDTITVGFRPRLILMTINTTASDGNALNGFWYFADGSSIGFRTNQSGSFFDLGAGGNYVTSGFSDTVLSIGTITETGFDFSFSRDGTFGSAFTVNMLILG